MTKWIDEYAKSLGEAANSDNVQRQHDVLRDRLIQQQGPKFFAKLTDALRAQAAELDERVGASLKGITATDDRNPASILVSSGDGSVSLRCTSNYSARTMLAVTNCANAIAGAKERTFSIAVNEQTAQISLRSDPDPDAYEDAIPLATKLLREAVYREVGGLSGLRPRKRSSSKHAGVKGGNFRTMFGHLPSMFGVF